MKFQRINVIGTSGMGKSTFCRKLSEISGYPHIQLDALFWMPGWKCKENSEFYPLLEKSLDQPCWILDGNYQSTSPIKWKNADLVIWLDYSFSLNLYRSFKRAIQRIITRENLWGTGNRESIRRSFFSKDSILLWTIQTHHLIKREYELTIKDDAYQHIKFIRFKTPKEADQFLNNFDSQ